MRNYGNIIKTTKDRTAALEFKGSLTEAKSLAATYERKLHARGFQFFVGVYFANCPRDDTFVFHVEHTGENGFDPTYLAGDA